MHYTNFINAEKKLEKYLAVLVALSMLATTIGFLTSVRNAQAANLTSLSDTLQDSDLGVRSNHTIQFNTPTGVSSSQTMVVVFPTAASQFSSSSIGGLLEDDVDFVVNGVSASTTGACSGTFSVGFSTTTGAATSSVTFTLCSGYNIGAAATTTVRIGSNAVDFGTGDANRRVINPSSAGSYEINIRGTQADTGDLRVAIIDDVVVTANVDTSLTFTIAGLNNGTDVNGTSTTATSTATTLAFGTLPVGSPVTMGQELTVATNARNGFVVTVVQDQNLLSSTGADIDLFVDANATATPSTWVAPSNSITNENTWGHIGLTSEDSDLNSDEFGTALFAGNFDAARQVFSHTGPANGTTVDKGLTQVAYRIQITALQEAGDDYTNVLTYVATPTF